LNYNWGGYVAHLFDVGKTGAVLAVFYAILIARAPLAKLAGWLIWALWLGFGSGTRGEVVFMMLPMIALVFVKHQSMAAAMIRGATVRAYLFAAIALGVILALVQIQAAYRNKGFSDVD